MPRLKFSAILGLVLCAGAHAATPQSAPATESAPALDPAANPAVHPNTAMIPAPQAANYH